MSELRNYKQLSTESQLHGASPKIGQVFQGSLTEIEKGQADTVRACFSEAQACFSHDDILGCMKSLESVHTILPRISLFIENVLDEEGYLELLSEITQKYSHDINILSPIYGYISSISSFSPSSTEFFISKGALSIAYQTLAQNSGMFMNNFWRFLKISFSQFPILYDQMSDVSNLLSISIAELSSETNGRSSKKYAARVIAGLIQSWKDPESETLIDFLAYTIEMIRFKLASCASIAIKGLLKHGEAAKTAVYGSKFAETTFSVFTESYKDFYEHYPDTIDNSQKKIIRGFLSIIAVIESYSPEGLYESSFPLKEICNLALCGISEISKEAFSALKEFCRSGNTAISKISDAGRLYFFLEKFSDSPFNIKLEIASLFLEMLDLSSSSQFRCLIALQSLTPVMEMVEPTSSEEYLRTVLFCVQRMKREGVNWIEKCAPFVDDIKSKAEQEQVLHSPTFAAILDLLESSTTDDAIIEESQIDPESSVGSREDEITEERMEMYEEYKKRAEMQGSGPFGGGDDSQL